MTTTEPKINILYEDEDILAVDKPAGMLVHRGWAKDPVVLVDVIKTITNQHKAFPLHRLDRQTSGVVLFAKHAGAASILRSNFENGQVQKVYVALVRGEAPPSGVIDHPIPSKEKGPRVDAVTTFRCLETMKTSPRHLSVVEARPQTGRLHQIRRHLKHINHPVIGDANYGKGPLNRAIRERYGLKRMALHASMLRFVHPKSAKEIIVYAPLPVDLEKPLRLMGFRAGLDLSDSFSPHPQTLDR